MENPRRSLKGLLKNGDNFKARKINLDDPEVKIMLEAVKEEKKKCLERKKVNWAKLNNTYVNI
ncbi:MAG: hypothetical protein WC333_01620 [Dehalococcoidia bacterium]